MYWRNGSGSRLPTASETAPSAKAKGQRDSIASCGTAVDSNSLAVMVISPIGADDTTGGAGDAATGGAGGVAAGGAAGCTMTGAGFAEYTGTS